MTVLLWGVAQEAPMRMVGKALARRSADLAVIDCRSLAHTHVDIEIDNEPEQLVLAGTISASGRIIRLDSIRAAYLRPVEPDFAPWLTPTQRIRARRVHDILASYTEFANTTGACRTANPLSAMGSNMSKPYQSQLIARHGFYTPVTLVSDNPHEVLHFVELHGGAIYKSTSGVRSVVSAFDPIRDAHRLARLRWCPVQFQERIKGPDVRVHVVGEQAFAVRIETPAIDYRYARSQAGVDAQLQPYRLPDDVTERCISLAADLGLPFAGIDLKLCPDGRIACFEVNPSPGFSWFESETGLPIADAVADWLLYGGR
ncbi:ATP-grasp domain-containing protein [Streptomyces sp. NPDC001233]|uniref:ATP-grasp domain-containing protein n=1 Tax=Streptomyces sp. NPDC002589 TaxID=3154420 RepID=UPI00331AA556